MTKPHRKDEYEHRQAVKVRLELPIIEDIDAIANQLGVSRAHFVDLVIVEALTEERNWLVSRLTNRLTRALERRRSQGR